MSMTHVVRYLFAAVINIGSITIVPVLWYWIQHGEFGIKGFGPWMGIFLPHRGVRRASLILAAVFLSALSVTVAVVLSGYSGRSGEIEGGLTPITFLLLVIFALRSGIGEEILFRGFIAKRLIGWLGFRWGNPAQALVFASIHVSMSGPGSVADRVVRVLCAFAWGYAFGHVMEKECDGSIVPGIAAHAAYNFTASLVLAAIYMGVSLVVTQCLSTHIY